MANFGTGNDGPGVGQRDVFDGRRWMLWLVRTTQPFPEPPPGPRFVQADSIEPIRLEEAVLDVTVLPPEGATSNLRRGLRRSRGAYGSGRLTAAWDLDYSTGRIRAVNVSQLHCPDPKKDRD